MGVCGGLSPWLTLVIGRLVEHEQWHVINLATFLSIKQHISSALLLLERASGEL